MRAKGKEGERESAHFEGERGREGFGTARGEKLIIVVGGRGREF